MNGWKKSAGTTASERILAEFGEKAFLSLWSYPNPYVNDRTRRELCDLLVVFGNDIILFSDKFCEFPESGNPKVDWRRWYRRCILKAVRQVLGAESRIKRDPGGIFLDPDCSQPLPFPLPALDHAKFHRVVIARGAEEKCADHHHRETGSLAVKTDILAEGHECTAFTIGKIDPHSYVHVFDGAILEILLSELDTVADFVRYLDNKENLISPRPILLADGEEDILAYYLANIDEIGDHGFQFPDTPPGIKFQTGLWKKVRTNPQYLRRKQIDRVSYVWDQIIQEFSSNHIKRTAAAGNFEGTAQFEPALRIMAAERRTVRRGYSHTIMRDFAQARPDETACTVLIPENSEKYAYIFLAVPPPKDRDYQGYTKLRRNMLRGHAKVLRSMRPDLERIVAIGSEPITSPGSSYDFVFLDVSQWTNSDEEEARLIQHVTNILTRGEFSTRQILEYPPTPDVEIR